MIYRNRERGRGQSVNSLPVGMHSNLSQNKLDVSSFSRDVKSETSKVAVFRQKKPKHLTDCFLTVICSSGLSETQINSPEMTRVSILLLFSALLHFQKLAVLENQSLMMSHPHSHVSEIVS